MTHVLSERNLVTCLREHEATQPTPFDTIEAAVASILAHPPWRLHDRLQTYGLDPTLRRSWERRNKRRRVLRKHVRDTTKLHIDGWMIVLNTAKPLQILMLGMTCKPLRDAVRNDHGLWRRLYLEWERQSNPPFKTLFQVTPGGWLTRPPGVPLPNWWKSEAVDKPAFNAIAHKTIALHHMPCCSMCGQTRRKTDIVWGLNMRLCSNCWRGNLISNRVLQTKYGLRLTDPYPNDHTTTLIEACFGRVYYFYCDGGVERRRFTYAPEDFTSDTQIIFLWEPHLRQMIDLDRLCRDKWERASASRTLSPFIKRLRVLNTIHKSFSRGVTEGFSNMNMAAKMGVLHNLHSLQIAGFAIRVFEPLFHTYDLRYQALLHAGMLDGV